MLRGITGHCPSTSFQYTTSENAAGTTVWQDAAKPPPDTCVNVAASGIKAYKVCGPGTFTVSRMSCDHHDYKPVKKEHPDDVFTEGDCKVYDAKGTNVEGYVG